MKKLCILFSIMMLIFIGSTSFAKIGDVVGNIYSTDIKAYINNFPVKAYNIGGRTCVPIEDVTMGCSYNNDYRTLLITSFDPSLIKRNVEPSTTNKVGKVIGNIYSTDIKTFFYDARLASYNIGGKTCVALEDLGGVGNFSSMGGVCFWNPDARTISLDILYDNRTEMMDTLNDFNYGMKVENGNVTFVPELVSPGWITVDYSEIFDSYGEIPNIIYPFYYTSGSERILVGYTFSTLSRYFVYDDENNAQLRINEDYTFNYFYVDEIEDILMNMEHPNSERNEVIEEHIERWMADPYERFDTDEYSFLYLFQPTPHGRNSLLLYVRADGSYEYVHDMLPKGNGYTRAFHYLNIDRDNELVTIDVAGVEGRFVFDLKTGKLTETDYYNN